MTLWLHSFQELKCWQGWQENFPFPAYSAPLKSLNQATFVPKQHGELVECILWLVPHQESFPSQKEHCEKTFVVVSCFWWPGQTPCCLRVQQQPLHYIQWGTNLRKEPKSPVLTLVQQVSEFEKCMLHPRLLRIVHWQHWGMNVFPLCGMNHIRLLNQKQAHQQCGNGFFFICILNTERCEALSSTSEWVGWQVCHSCSELFQTREWRFLHCKHMENKAFCVRQLRNTVIAYMGTRRFLTRLKRLPPVLW